MKFFSALETIERVDQDIVERDTRGMEICIQGAKDMTMAAQQISKLNNSEFFDIFAKLSDDWNLFDQDVFIVS